MLEASAATDGQWACTETDCPAARTVCDHLHWFCESVRLPEDADVDAFLRCDPLPGCDSGTICPRGDGLNTCECWAKHWVCTDKEGIDPLAGPVPYTPPSVSPPGARPHSLQELAREHRDAGMP